MKHFRKENDMEFVATIIFGLLCSIATSLVWVCRTSSGVLKIDHMNPEKDVYRFEIDDLDNLGKKSRITLRIDHNANLSQD